MTDLCLRYPLLSDFFAFENTNFGLDVLFGTFNGIRELFKRKDVAENLVNKYMEKIRSFSFLTESNSDLEKGFFIITVSKLEALLSRIECQDIEKESIKKVLLSLVFGYEEKIKLPEYFKGLGFQTNFYARAHIIAKMDSAFIEQLPEKEKNNALYSGRISDEKTINLIDMFSYKLIK